MPRDLGTRPGEAGGSGQAAWTEISPGRGKSFLIASHLFTEEELPRPTAGSSYAHVISLSSFPPGSARGSAEHYYHI